MSVRRCGGGYGSKLGKAGVAAVTSAMAAHLLQRPVRVVLSIEENMEAVGKRSGCLFKYEVSNRVLEGVRQGVVGQWSATFPPERARYYNYV